MALIAGYLTSGQAWAHDDELKVTGFYDVIFIRADFLGQQNNGLPIIDVALQGPFELTIGGVLRTGTITFPHIAKIAEPTGMAHGAAAWVFDDGLTCVGFLGGTLSAQGLVGEGEFDRSDGSKLSVDVMDTDVVGGVSVKAEINGVLEPDDDDDD